MKKIIIGTILLILIIVAYIQIQKPEIEIIAKTEMESSLNNNILTQPYLTDNVLRITLIPKKDYSNLSLNITSDGLNFEPLQPINYFDLIKKRSFNIKIFVRNEYKEGSVVDYSVKVYDNNKQEVITTKSFEYEVGKVKLWDKIRSVFWGFMALVILALILIRKDSVRYLKYFQNFLNS